MRTTRMLPLWIADCFHYGFRDGRAFLRCVPLMLWLVAGCTWDQLNPLAPPVGDVGAGETFVLRPEGLVAEKKQERKGASERLRAGHELFRREQYSQAERVYESIVDNKRNPADIVQEALYYQAECLRLQGRYPRAADTYNKLLSDFNHLHTPYREQAIRHIYDICNYWLDDTRKEMRENAERREGKRTFVMPRFVSFERSKPLLDREGRAIDLLEQVNLYDSSSPLAANALFMCGTVKLYRENYHEADIYFTQVHRNHRHREETEKLAAKALELAIFCKQMSTGGPDYDGRKVAEARELVQAAWSTPGLAEDKGNFLKRQEQSLNLHQAAKDFKKANFYLRTGHPASAYFYYELVRRRYPGTIHARKATEKMQEIRSDLQEEMVQKGQAPGNPNAGPVPRQVAQPPRGGQGAPGTLDRAPEPAPSREKKSPGLLPPQPLPPVLQTSSGNGR